MKIKLKNLIKYFKKNKKIFIIFKKLIIIFKKLIIIYNKFKYLYIINFINNNSIYYRYN